MSHVPKSTLTGPHADQRTGGSNTTDCVDETRGNSGDARTSGYANGAHSSPLPRFTAQSFDYRAMGVAERDIPRYPEGERGNVAHLDEEGGLSRDGVGRAPSTKMRSS